MNQDIDISISKLSAPVGALAINRRTCCTLRRAGIHMVAEILLAGKPRLSAMRQIGDLTVSRIFTALSGYVGVPEEQLAGAVDSLPGARQDAWEAPVRALPLPVSTTGMLEEMGCFRVRELLKARASGYERVLGLSAWEMFEVDQALNEYLNRAVRSRLVRWAKAESLPEDPSPSPVLVLPGLGESDWSILEWRVMQLLSPGEISARSASPGSKRLYQGVRRAHEHVRQKLKVLSLFLDELEEKSDRLRESLGTGPLEPATLIRHLLPDPAASDLVLQEKEIERLIILLLGAGLRPRRDVDHQVSSRPPHIR